MFCRNLCRSQVNKLWTRSSVSSLERLHHNSVVIGQLVETPKLNSVTPQFVFSRELCVARVHQVCWNCGSNIDSLVFFCPSCRKLQKPSDVDYFTLFSLHKGFDVDRSLLTKQFRHLQTQLHPDKFSTKSREEKLLSEDYSALLNKAYSTLLDPLSRGLYLLSEHGISLEEADSLTMDQDFLMLVMEFNEQLDSVTNGEQLDKLELTNKSEIESCVSQVSQAFARADYHQAKYILAKLKYFVSNENRIKNMKQNAM